MAYRGARPAVTVKNAPEALTVQRGLIWGGWGRGERGEMPGSVQGERGVARVLSWP